METDGGQRVDIGSKLKDWLPACFHPLSQSETHLSGYVSSESELQSVLECYSRVTLTTFVKWSDDKARVRKSGSKRRLLWKFEDYSNNVPLTIQNRQILSCQFGKAKPPKPKKEISAWISQQPTEDHHSYSRKRRFHIQKSRKVNCPAKIYIRHVLRYDDFKVKKSTSKIQRQIILDNLDAMMSKGETITTQCMIHIKLPFIEAHENHRVSLESGFARRIHPEIRDKIYEYVSHGVTSVPLLKRALKQHVLTELCKKDDIKPHPHDRCYFPSNAVIQSHVHLALVAGQYSGLDQENLERKIHQWQLSDPNADFFLRKCMEGATSTSSHQVEPEGSVDTQRERGFPSEVEDDVDDNDDDSFNFIKDMAVPATFLFVHQTEKQRKLLERYGDMVLLDATYRTTKYALPLFLMVVRTNVNYIPVAQFICENETTEAISEALGRIKTWNPKWKPRYFMLDYSEQEFQALHKIFPATRKYLCSFHREQAWIRWTRENKNQLSTGDREDLLKSLRHIALSTNEEACDREISQLRNSALYLTNDKVKNYVEKRWLDIQERWCRAYAPEDFCVAVNTNNGVEALNNSLKRFYLSLSGTGTLSSLVETLVSDFIPEQLLTYTQLNYSFSSQYRTYNPEIPQYLHNRPRSFVKTCLRRLVASADFSKKDVLETGGQNFKVKSEMSADWYEVYLGDDNRYPSCTCVSFRTTFLPCKHMFAVFNNTAYTWDSLSSKYRDSPYLNLDENFLSSESLQKCPAAIQECGDSHDQAEGGDEGMLTSSPMAVHSPLILNLQASVREKLKSLCDSSYLCMDIDCLQTVNTELDKLDKVLKKGVPMEDHLPIHQSQDAVPKQSLRRLPKRNKSSSLSRKRKKNLNGRSDISISSEQVDALSNTSSPNAMMSEEVMSEEVTFVEVPMRKEMHAKKSSLSNKDSLPSEENPTHKRRNIKRVRFACDNEISKTKDEDKTSVYKKGKTTEVQSGASINKNVKKAPPTFTKNIMEEYARLSSELETFKGVPRLTQTKKRYYVCGEVLEDTDFATLTHPKWLNDKVINAYLACLKMSTNTGGSHHIFVLPSYTAVLWDLGRMDTWLFKKVKFSMFSWIFLPINVNECHWILLAADVSNRMVSLLDSMHGKSGEKYLDLWRNFMQIRDTRTDEKLGNWVNGNVISAKQQDGNTCGAFVLVNALALTRGIPPNMMRHADAVSMRKFALGKLLDAAVKPPSQRSVCDMVGCSKSEGQQDWIACDVCGRWCHFKCVNIKRKPKGSYVCPICRAQYD